MRSKTTKMWAILLAGLGVLCLVAAAILAWMVVPNRKQLPADTNTVRDFTGTANVLLNPQAIASGALSSALLTNVPVQAQRTVKVLATDGDAAEVSDLRTLSTTTGPQLAKNDAVYAVDRRSLEATDKHPDSWQVIDHSGLVVSWPIGAEKKDYPAWVNETKTTTTARFVREEKRNGATTYVYESDAPAAPIKDEQVLATLPKALPATALGALAAGLPIPAELKARLAQALPALGDPVPLSYTYESKSTIWVEPTTGIVVDTNRHETRKAGIGTSAVASVPVYDVTVKFTDQSTAAAVDDATDKKSAIERYGKTWPWILTVAGLVSLLAAVLLALLGRRSRAAAPAAVSATAPERGGDDDRPRRTDLPERPE